MSEREVEPGGEALILRFTYADRLSGDADEALRRHLAGMSYATEHIDGLYNPDPEITEFALVYPGVGDRAGEFVLVHFSRDGQVYYHKCRDRQALEARAAELPAMAIALHRERAQLAEHFASGSGYIGFYRPPEPRDKRPQRKQRRRMSRESRRKNR